MAALLDHVGIGPGDVVGALISKRPEVVIGFLALARLGAIYAPINFKLHPTTSAISLKPQISERCSPKMHTTVC